MRKESRVQFHVRGLACDCAAFSTGKREYLVLAWFHTSRTPTACHSKTSSMTYLVFLLHSKVGGLEFFGPWYNGPGGRVLGRYGSTDGDVLAKATGVARCFRPLAHDALGVLQWSPSPIAILGRSLHPSPGGATMMSMLNCLQDKCE